MSNYNHQNYQHDPLPAWQQPTSGQLPVVHMSTPLPKIVEKHTPLPKHSPIDSLASHSQRVIRKYAEDIWAALNPPCDCAEHRNYLQTALADLISEVLTDQTILTLSIQKVERSINRLADNMEQILRGMKHD